VGLTGVLKHIKLNQNTDGGKMTKIELIKILKEHGWQIMRQGKHEIWGNGGLTIPIPRHKGDIPKGTADNILRRAGIQGQKK
jgi:predicted RNA binding protein YcfA (HicA-like mRNA interferase family)